MDFTWITDAILNNQVVTGLSVTALLGAVAYQLRNVPHMISVATLRFMTVELTVNSTDPAFDWVDRWLASQSYAKRAKMLTLRSHSEQDDSDQYRPLPRQSDSWTLSPGPGLHIFWWRKRPVVLERRYLSKETGEDTRRSKPVEILKLRTIGRSQRVVRRLIDDVRTFSLTSNVVAIRVWSEGYWATIRGKSIRPLDTIILQDGQMERIIADLVWFQEARDWYVMRGIPYRRGYLLRGSPGTGKTSLVMAMAGFFSKPICVLSLNAVTDDPALFTAFNEAPANAIILIEDVDCAFPAQTRDQSDKETGKVTKAGLLNAIDGITTPDGRIFVMTTNFPERLDPALIRPGRADVHELFEFLGQHEQCRMAARFYTEPFEPLPFAVSPAALQAAFILHPSDPQAAHDMLLEG